MRLQLRGAIEAEALRKSEGKPIMQRVDACLHGNQTAFRSQEPSHKTTLPLHKFGNDIDKFIRADADVESKLITKSGERGLRAFAESPMSKTFTNVSDKNQHDNLQRLPQDDPECYTQLSELASFTTPTPGEGKSQRKTFATPRYSDRDFEHSEENVTRLDSQQEDSINLDSPCPLWSQGKTLISPATETETANPGAVTTQTQSSSPFTAIYGPPRFSELLTQNSQRNPIAPKATQRTAREIGKRKSGPLHPAKYSKTAATVQDDGKGATLCGSNLREQILACLLEPDFEDFVAEVEKVWDEIQESVSDNLESQVLANRLEQGAAYLLSQSRSNSLAMTNLEMGTSIPKQEN